MTYAALYITTADITDSVARDFISDSRVLIWMQRADEELGSLALTLGVPIASIYTPVNSRVRDYVIANFCYLLFRDVNGENEVENPGNEVHIVKMKQWKEVIDELRTLITKEQLLQVVTSLTPSQMVNVGVIWRG